MYAIRSYYVSGDRLGIVLEFVKERGRFVKELIIHLNITFKSVFFAILFGIPMGVIAWKNRILNPYIFGFINTLQTIPSLALFGLLIAPLSYISNKFPVLKSVITSYSIHYTKLYDRATPWWALSRAGAGSPSTAKIAPMCCAGSVRTIRD